MTCLVLNNLPSQVVLATASAGTSLFQYDYRAIYALPTGSRMQINPGHHPSALLVFQNCAVMTAQARLLALLPLILVKKVTP